MGDLVQQEVGNTPKIKAALGVGSYEVKNLQYLRNGMQDKTKVTVTD